MVLSCFLERLLRVLMVCCRCMCDRFGLRMSIELKSGVDEVLLEMVM